MTHRSPWLIVILLFSCSGLCFAQATSVRFVDEGGKVIAQADAVVRGDGLYFTIQVLRDAFDPAKVKSLDVFSGDPGLVGKTFRSLLESHERIQQQDDKLVRVS